MDYAENMAIERRLKAYADYQQRQQQLRSELNSIHAQAITRQMESGEQRRREVEAANKQLDKKTVAGVGAL